MATAIAAGTGSAPAAAAHYPVATPTSYPGFVANDTKAIWDGETVSVVFRETGVKARTWSRVLIRATAQLRRECAELPGVKLTAAATTVTVGVYPAFHLGWVSGSHRLPLIVTVPRVGGVPCTSDVTPGLQVTVHDITTGAQSTFAGRVLPFRR